MWLDFRANAGLFERGFPCEQYNSLNEFLPPVSKLFKQFNLIWDNWIDQIIGNMFPLELLETNTA